MKLLLDTHIFLWYITNDNRLSTVMRTAIRDLNNEVYLSVVSFWEAMLKYQLGKLPLPHSPNSYLSMMREQHQIASLPLDESSMGYLLTLPMYHRDPFDRMLICQALAHNLVIATVDQAITGYAVPVLQV